MMSQGPVPNTYAAGRASLAMLDRRREPPAQEAFEIVENISPESCECGQPRRLGKTSCDRCARLESGRDQDAIDREILTAFDVGEEMTSAQVFERLEYKLDRKLIYRVLRKLEDEQKITKRSTGRRVEGFIYKRVA